MANGTQQMAKAIVRYRRMKCQCSELSDAFYIDEEPADFEMVLKREEDGNWKWLGSCPQCGALWAVDAWDKYQEQVIIRVGKRDGWDDADTMALRKELLFKSRGGTTDSECIRAGCHGKAIKGVVYCLDHLWEAGARR